ncbi:MAG TPA: PfkB family carbohydrate kinase [Pseudolysinimonas sp.]
MSVGNVVVDLIAELPRLPVSGEDLTATASGVSIGGSANTLVAARRQGLAAVYAGAHGAGPLGAFVRAELEAAGIGIAHEPVAGDTGWDVAIVEPGGERTFVTTVGAEAGLDGTALASFALDLGDLLHVSGYGLAREPSGPALAAWLPSVDHRVTVLLDPGPMAAEIAPDVIEPVLERIDWWSGNEAEALAATGAGDAISAADRLSRRGFGVVVRQGAAGCLLVERGGTVQRVGGFAVDAIDSNGAGDAHVGVFLAALASGHTPVDAARRANAAAAIAVTRRGPTSAPTADELEAFLVSADPS